MFEGFLHTNKNVTRVNIIQKKKFQISINVKKRTNIFWKLYNKYLVKN